MFWGSGDRKKKAPKDPATPETPSAAPASDVIAEREMTLRSLVELSNDLNARMDLFEIADVALYNLMGHFGCSRSALWYLSSDDSSEAVLLRRSGLPDQAARSVGTLWARWLRTGGLREPLLLEDLRSASALPGLELAAESGIAVLAPVTARLRLVGMVALGERISGKKFSTRDLDAVAASLNFAGTALENAASVNRMAENNRQLTQANERLQELDDLKSEFLRNLNHELRTPLTVIAAYADSLLLGEDQDSPRREHFQALRTETTKLETMLLTLLDFGKLMQEEGAAECTRGDVVHAMRAYFDDRRPGVAAGLRELRFSHQSDVVPAHFEPGTLIRILDCLVDNAVKFCPPGSCIHLRVDTADQRVRVDVRDDGPGIPPDRLPHIWESFRQGDGSETRTHGGMGVGLAFARGLAQRMDGTLDVQTEVGKGTTFSLTLPTG